MAKMGEQLILKGINIGEDLEQVYHLHVASEDVKWFSYFEKLFGNFLQG